MKKTVFFILACCALLVGCSIESDMKKRLKTETMANCPEYKLVHFEISDSILYHDLKDTISGLKEEIVFQESLIESDSSFLQRLKNAQDDCRRTARGMPYYLKSSMDRIIREYDEMIAKRQTKIEEYQSRINNLSMRINEADSLLGAVAGEDSLVFYVVNHQYDCGGGSIYEKVYFNKQLDIYKAEYNEN